MICAIQCYLRDTLFANLGIHILTIEGWESTSAMETTPTSTHISWWAWPLAKTRLQITDVLWGDLEIPGRVTESPAATQDHSWAAVLQW